MWEGCGALDELDAAREPVGSPVSATCPLENSESCPMVGGTQTSFKRTHAEQGHVFVVAASHLIFRFLQPLQARITDEFIRNAPRNTVGRGIAYPLIVCVCCVRPQTHSLEHRCPC